MNALAPNAAFTKRTLASMGAANSARTHAFG